MGRVAAGVGVAVCPGRVEGKWVGWVEGMGVCWVVVKVCEVGLYSLSSSVGWKVGDLTASYASLAFPFWVGSTSIFHLRREFSCRSASISSALRFFRSANSCCILAWSSRMAARSGVMLVGPEGPASACLLAPTLLRVETIFGEKQVVNCYLVPHGGRQLFLQRRNKIS